MSRPGWRWVVAAVVVGLAGAVVAAVLLPDRGDAGSTSPRLLAPDAAPYGRSLPDPDGDSLAMQGLLPVCAGGGEPVTVTDVRPMAGDLVVTDWTVLPAGSTRQYDGRPFAETRPERNDVVRSRCGGADGDSIPDTQAFDDILIELRRPGPGDAELRGVGVTYAGGDSEGTVRLPLSAALCTGEADGAVPQCDSPGG